MFGWEVNETLSLIFLYLLPHFPSLDHAKKEMVLMKIQAISQNLLKPQFQRFAFFKYYFEGNQNFVFQILTLKRIQG